MIGGGVQTALVEDLVFLELEDATLPYSRA